MLTIERLLQQADINAMCARAGYAETEVEPGARQHFLNGLHSAAASLLDILNRQAPTAWLVTGSPDFEDETYKTAERAEHAARSRMDGSVAVPVYRLPAPTEPPAQCGDAVDDALTRNAADPSALLAADHVGFRVNYEGLLDGVQRRLEGDSPGEAELIRQLHEHLTELGQRWYRGDTAVVDEVLQLYCVEREARRQVKQMQIHNRG